MSDTPEDNAAILANSGPWGAPPPGNNGSNGGKSNSNKGEQSGERKTGSWGNQQNSNGNGGNRGGNRGGGGGNGFGQFQRGFNGQDPFEAFQAGLKQRMPKGFGGSRGIFMILLLVLAIWLLSGFYRVQQGQVGVELVFGKYNGASTEPGLNYNLPYPIGEVLTPEVERSRRIDIGYRGSIPDGSASNNQKITTIPEESLILTGDQNIVDLAFAVFWKIDDPRAFLFNIREQEQTIRIAAESAMREVLGQTDFDKAVTDGRAAIESRALTVLQEVLDGYNAGVLIEKVDLQKSDPPSEVIDAFNDVQRARQDRDRLRNQAEAYANTIVPEARGEAEQILRGAEAYRERLIKESEGEAERFLENLAAYQTAPSSTRNRMYLETISEVLANSNKIIVDDAVTGIVPYLPLNELPRNTGVRADNTRASSPPATSSGQLDQSGTNNAQ